MHGFDSISTWRQPRPPTASAARTDPADAVLIVDSVFAFRPEYNDLWDFRIWLDVNPDLSLARGRPIALTP